MSDFTNRFGQWHYIGAGTLTEAKRAAHAAGITRFTFAGTEWYWHRREWQHD